MDKEDPRYPIFYQALVMHVAQGLLSAQTDDRHYRDTPERKKAEIFSDEVLMYAKTLMKKIDQD